MRSSRCEWRRAWTIGRLTGCLHDPVARHVGDHCSADNPKFLRNVRLTSTGRLPKDNRRSRQPPLSHFGRPRLPHPPQRATRRACMGHVMDSFSTLDLALFAAGTFAAAFVTGLAGFAFAIVAAAVWLHFLSPMQAGAL